MKSKIVRIMLFCLLSVVVRAQQSEPHTPAQTTPKVYWYIVDKASNDYSEHTNLAVLKLKPTPIFSSDDLVYYKTNNSFRLTDSAYKRLYNLSVPMAGAPYVVCVGERRLYLGTFCAMISSWGGEGRRITRPENSENTELKIEGDPHRPWILSEDDLRNDAELTKALDALGKLKRAS